MGINNARACFGNSYEECLLKEIFFITIKIMETLKIQYFDMCMKNQL